MTDLHMVRATIDVSALARWAWDRGWAGGGRRLGYDEGRALHHLVDEVFGPGALRPFRLLVPPRSRTGTLYGYASADAPALRDVAGALAKPDHLTVLTLERLDSRFMPDVWRVGRRLGFDVRVRPVQRLRDALSTSTGNMPAGAEVDAFLREALRSHPEAPDGMERSGRTREAVYLDWIAQRLAPAARLDPDSSRLVRFRRTRVSRGGTSVEGPDAIVHGTMTVVDREAFASLLRQGIGRHRAYGYGMLLLTAPQRQRPER